MKRPIAETKARSASKSIIWRIMGVLILGAVTYAYTGNWITTGLITFIHHGVFLIVFYFHERFWLWLDTKVIFRPFWRSVAKMFTYETLLGNIILGIITYAITGSAKEMTQITLTYIGIKHVTYVFNEFVWNKIKMGKV